MGKRQEDARKSREAAQKLAKEAHDKVGQVVQKEKAEVQSFQQKKKALEQEIAGWKENAPVAAAGAIVAAFLAPVTFGTSTAVTAALAAGATAYIAERMNEINELNGDAQSLSAEFRAQKEEELMRMYNAEHEALKFQALQKQLSVR